MAKHKRQAKRPDAEAAFSNLFWAARKEHVARGKSAAASDPAHSAAVAFADAQGWPWGDGLLEASRLIRADPDKALSLLTELASSVPERCQGLFHFVRGTALSKKGEHDEAIK